MNDPFLKIDLRLLIARYGRRHVLQCLADVGESTIEEIEAQLKEIEKAKDKKARPSRKTSDEILAEMTEISPSAREKLKSLAAYFDSRTFLPQLRDVNIFLERRGYSKTSKSRNEAFPQVLRVLANLDDQALKELLESVTSRVGSSDYLLLANEIMGNHLKPTEKPPVN